MIRRESTIPTRAEAMGAVQTILCYIDDYPDREGLRDTPRRFVDMLDEMKAARHQNFEPTSFPTVTSNDLVVIKDIPLYSLCEHHIMIYSGKIDIGYLPDATVLGLSKFARIVAKAQAGLTIQEKLTRQIANTLVKAAHTPDIAVVSEAVHSCMVARGARAHGSSTVSSVMLGAFREDAALRSEFLRLAGR